MEGHCQVFSEFSQFTCLCINIGTKICLWKILVWEIDLLTFSSLIFIYFPGLEILPTICQNLDFATVSRSWNFNFCCQPVGTWNSWTFLFVPLFISCLPVAIFPWYLNVVAHSCQVWSSLSFWIFSNSVFPASFSTAIIIGKPKLHMKLELSPSLWGRKGQYQWHITTKKAF